MELIKKIAKKFEASNWQLFEVGGYVRDSILGRESYDIDLATNAKPEVVKELVEEFGSIYSLHPHFGTVGLIVGKQLIEITTYRSEVYDLDSRKPRVTFGNNIVDDLSRRDFTVNAMARHPLTGGIIDPFGGIKDIEAKVIRCVGKDEDRFNEDPLRMMRAVRLACQLNFRMEVRITRPERLKIVSNERIRDEFIKILLSLKPGFGVRRLCSLGMMEYIFPEVVHLKNIEQGKYHIKDAFHHSLLVLDKGARVDHKEYNLIFRLACLLHDIAKPETKTEDNGGVHFYNHHFIGYKKARKALKRLKFDKETVDRTCHLIKFHMTPIMLQKELSAGEIKKRVIMRMIRRVGENDIYLLIDLVKCDIRSSKNSRYKFMNVLTNLVDECMKERPETLVSPLDGDEIMELFSLKPSRAVGKIKTYLTNLTVDGIIDKDDKEAAKEKAREFIKTQLIGEIMNGET